MSLPVAPQEAFDLAMHHNEAESHEPMQGMASLRLSQGNPAEASQLMTSAYERIVSSAVPVEPEARLAAARLLLECAPHAASCADAALDLLANLMREDDENIEVWFLMGVGFFQQSPPDLALSTEYLVGAQTMLGKVRESMGGQSLGAESFPYAEQVRLVEEQLILVEEHRKVHGDGGDEEGEEGPQEGVVNGDGGIGSGGALEMEDR